MSDRLQRVLDNKLTNLIVVALLIYAAVWAIDYLDGPKPITVWHAIFTACIAYLWGREDGERVARK